MSRKNIAKEKIPRDAHIRKSIGRSARKQCNSAGLVSKQRFRKTGYLRWPSRDEGAELKASAAKTERQDPEDCCVVCPGEIG
jgi:hypothetical protein